MLNALGFVARHGRYALVLGLAAGLFLPSLAATLKPWLPEMVAFLLFLTAFRIGAPAAMAGLRDGAKTFRVALIYQLALPLIALGAFATFGVLNTPYAFAILLMLCAPSVTGSPNIAILLGANPEPAFRILIIGTAIVPLTMIPTFWLAPGLGDLTASAMAALRLLVTIWAAIAVGFALRHWTVPSPSKRGTDAMDGVMALAMSVIVVGLMSALGPALLSSPGTVLIWMTIVLAANLGLQCAAFFIMQRLNWGRLTVPLSIVAGNRNVALFLVTLPAATTEPLLIFLGCYQIPMYLTAIIMRPIYRAYQV
jgi:ACR3 family arsenite transporter